MFLELFIPFLIAVLMGMGIGGGGLFVIYLTLCLNYGQVLAQGTNLIFFVLSILFSNLVHNVNPKIPKILLGALLIVSGIYAFIRNIKIKK